MADIDFSVVSEYAIAPDLKPTFRPCDLAVFCNNPTPKAKINFFKNCKAFDDYFPEILPKSVQQESFHLTNENKANMKIELDKCFANNSLSFNDEAIINIGLESVKPMMSKHLKTEESESIEDQVDNYTCESDEAFFKKDVQSDDEERIRIKTKEARFYTSTQRGKRIENPVILKVNQDHGFNFQQNKKYMDKDFGSFRIRGKTDGIDPEKRTLIEVKSRNKFDASKCTITEKKKIQPLVYMNLYDCDRCLFVVSGPDGKQKIEEIEWDEEKFNRVVISKLEKFTNYARSLTKEDFKDLIEKCNKK